MCERAVEALIAVVSGQPAPTLAAIRALLPTEVWLLETAEMAAAGRGVDLQRAIQMDVASLPAIRIAAIEGARDVNVMRRTIERRLQRLGGKPAVVLLNGGTKPMVIGTWLAARERARLIYLEPGTGGALVDLENGRVLAEAGAVPLRPLLRAHGFEVVDGRPIREAWPRLFSLAQAIASECPSIDVPDPGSGRPPDSITGRPAPSPQLERRIRHELPELAGCRPGDGVWRSFLTGGWLECFLRGAFVRAMDSSLPPGEVEAGIVVRSVHSGTRNELDLACTAGMRLIVVECKSGSTRIIDALYKLATVVRQFGVQQAEGMLVWSGSPRSGFVPALRRRAELLGCSLLPRTAVQRLARRPENVFLELAEDSNVGPR